MTLGAVKGINVANRFKANIYFLTKEEGGRSKPILNNYSQQLLSETWNLSCKLEFGIFDKFLNYKPPKIRTMISLTDNEMIMPGENAEVRVTIINKMVLNQGQKFTIRENRVIVATGVIVDLLDSVNVTGNFEKVQIPAKN